MYGQYGQIEGVLYYNTLTDRYCIRYGVEEYGDDLHCGDFLQVKIRGKWQDTRIEMDCGEWYLVGVKTSDLSGLPARQ